MKNSSMAILLVFLLLMAVLSCRRQETWKGSIETRDGVTIIKNPAVPMHSETAALLEEELAFGGAAADEQAMLSRPFSLAVDDAGNIYFLDIQAGHVKKFDAGGKFVMAIGRKGQGPGELQGPLSIQLTPEREILVHCLMSSRLAYFALDGTFLREIPLTKIPRAMVRLDSSGDFVCGAPESGEVFKIVLAKYGARQEKRFQIAAIDPRYSEIYFPFAPSIIFNVTVDDHIVWAITDQYEIMITDPQGRVIKKISRDYVPVEVTEADKQDLISRQGLPDPGAKVPNVYPPLQGEFPSIDESGRIFVKTYERPADGGGFFFDAFDASGRYLARIPLKQVPRVPLVWKSGRLYAVEEDEKGFYVVKRYKVGF